SSSAYPPRSTRFPYTTLVRSFNQLLLAVREHGVQHCLWHTGINHVGDQSTLGVIFKAMVMAPISQHAHGGVRAHISKGITFAIPRKVMARGPPQAGRKSQDRGAIGKPVCLLERSHRHKW